MESETKHILILAGGFGTRLRSVVSDVPKPLAPVGGRPFLEYCLESWKRQGFTDFTFLLHHQSAKIIKFLCERQEDLLKGCNVNWTVEEEPLGTGGAVAFAIRQHNIENSFIVANADTWLGGGASELSQQLEPCMSVVEVDNTDRYGEVILQNGKVVRITEKQQKGQPGWINAGMYKLSPEHFANWNGEPFSMETNLFPELIKSGKLNGFPLNVDFIDIGIPQDYERFILWTRSERKFKL
ncbi:hypothetical protein CH373_12265 [Leptospira perolatii]|uniref:Nucleotidyl transferase domain-containing protein n=1 Tax=Leptospira perolatii TaxID=2023191 RepID=A0A2M9ZL64_9LEPT|nr:sugar phosphate nucleotidyltransferase [Leptospira perolatii]PJZ70286.1 hypothetical protein CH360_06705 [Leptospira perolatii]PJZ72830.1 hypothetical protein CH373_12265 [Leptospira perolatii]